MLSPRDIVLHHVVIKGLADLDAIARATALDVEAVESITRALLDDGLLLERTGRFAGFAPTAEGRAAHSKALGESDLRGRRAELDDWCEQFEDLNVELKELCTAWQLRRAATNAVNDRLDVPYDEEVLSSLEGIHTRVGELISGVGHPRLNRYLARLEEAHSAVQLGDTGRLITPFSDSYHDVWMELHHDLLKTFDRERRPGDF